MTACQYLSFTLDAGHPSTLPLFGQPLFPADTRVITNHRVSLLYQPPLKPASGTLLNADFAALNRITDGVF